MLIDPIPSAHVDVKLFRIMLRLMLSQSETGEFTLEAVLVQAVVHWPAIRMNQCRLQWALVLICACSHPFGSNLGESDDDCSRVV
jgi:hypothetical protein